MSSGNFDPIMPELSDSESEYSGDSMSIPTDSDGDSDADYYEVTIQIILVRTKSGTNPVVCPASDKIFMCKNGVKTQIGGPRDDNWEWDF